MQKQILIILAAIIGTGAFAQSASTAVLQVKEEEARATPKFFFSARLLSDSAVFDKSLSLLAQQVADVFSETEKRAYYENAFRYHLLAGQYEKAIDELDSLQVLAENKALGIQFKSYATARREEAKGASFAKAYTTAFAALYEPLSFEEKVQAANYFNPNVAVNASKNFRQFTEKLMKGSGDSLSLKDAQTLLRLYSSHMIYGKVTSLSKPLIADNVKAMYPVIKSGQWAGVLPVQRVDEVPDLKRQYNLLVEITSGIKSNKDTTAIQNTNGGLEYMARLINLHAASGIPLKNIHVVALVHASATRALFANDVYKRKYGTDNPNLTLLKELQDAGVTFITCGQSMQFTNTKREDLLPYVKVSLTAQTVVSGYQSRNYVLYDLSKME